MSRDPQKGFKALGHVLNFACQKQVETATLADLISTYGALFFIRLTSLEGQPPELLLDESSLMFGLLKPEPVRKLVRDHRSGRQDNHKLLFSLVMLEQWLQLRGS
jgi:hypothetical protein